MTRFPPLDTQLEEIRRGAEEIIPEEGLATKLERSIETGHPLRVKQGFDPTRPDLHIGHAVSLRKLRTFQELGHEVIFVVGDYTARVGDPSGRSETRPRISPSQIEENARTYVEQVGKILDLESVRIEYNSSWLAPLDLAELLELSSRYTVARMLEREDFANRYREGEPISIHEFLYPLLQAYDSVALEADIELGGTDQRFNLLVGRTIQERYGQEPQVCLIMPLLRGTDGDLKMSKSYDNYIGITEPPNEQFGKTMSIPDTLLEEWYHLASGLTPQELDQMDSLIEREPYQTKRKLARAIVQTYHGVEEATRAEEEFDRIFKRIGLPEEIPEGEVSLSDPLARYTHEQGVRVAGILVVTGLATSNAEAARLIEQGAITIDGQRIERRDATIQVGPGERLLLRRGRRRFLEVTIVP